MTLPTFDLDEIKDDVGMPVAGSENDAWLERRIAGVWSRFETYTQRYLGASANFSDAWAPASPVVNAPAFYGSPQCGARYYLRNYPVSAIILAGDQGMAIDPLTVQVEASSGLLVGYGDAANPTRFVSPTITYTAGYETVPADLYECLIGVLRSLWTSRANDQSGISVGGLFPESLDISDVGNVKLGGANSYGFESGAREYADPYIGPYAYVLDTYSDLRALTGSGMLPRTTVVT